MAYEKRDGDISVFSNQKTSDRQPDWKGTLLLNGVTYDVALWSRGNGSVLSGRVEVNEKKRRDMETHNMIVGAANLAAHQAEPLYKTAERMTPPPPPEPEPPSMFQDAEDDLPF